jgi:hypothetical protein
MITFQLTPTGKVRNKPNNILEEIMGDIVLFTIHRLQKAYENPSIGINKIDPSVIICMLAVNLTVNLASGIMKDTLSVNLRLEMIEELAQRIHEMIVEGWKAIETAKVDKETAN